MLGSEKRRMFRATQRDDWHEVRSIAAGLRRRTAVVENLAGTAELIVGTIPDARRHLEAGVALGRNPDADQRFVRACARQLVSVERLAGDIPAARRRLAGLPGPSSGLEAAYVAIQQALVDLADGRPTAARDALEAFGVPTRALTSGMRQSLAADGAGAIVVLARARRDLGDLDGAGAALRTAASMLDARPYARGELLLAEAWLSHDQGRRPEAETTVTASLQRFEEVGAAVDAARARLLLAVLRGDRGELQLAEQTFRERGALGHLTEVDAARRDLGE